MWYDHTCVGLTVSSEPLKRLQKMGHQKNPPGLLVNPSDSCLVQLEVSMSTPSSVSHRNRQISIWERNRWNFIYRGNINNIFNSWHPQWLMLGSSRGYVWLRFICKNLISNVMILRVGSFRRSRVLLFSHFTQWRHIVQIFEPQRKLLWLNKSTGIVTPDFSTSKTVCPYFCALQVTQPMIV